MNMNLFFPWTEVKNRNKALTFDDVLIVPCRSDVKSRREPKLISRVTKKREIAIPIISSNMDTVTEQDMAIAMDRLGGLGILHRFMPIEQQVVQIQSMKDAGLQNLAASIGVSDDFKDRASALLKAGVNILTIDIAHGHSVQMIETISWVKDKNAEVEIIAGNVATPEATEDLINAGADAIKVGIGPGSMCTTRIITGCGVPQLTAIAICAEVAQRYNVPIIADGGLRNSGDIMKALSAGAHSVMLGKMLSGTLETPGEIKQGKKHYRGMASKSAQVSWRGGVPEGMAPEGESSQVAVKGPLKDVILEIIGGIRSGMSYINATEIHEIKERARFIEMSYNGMAESRAHGVSS
jgi:IMP dehydrogenase